jgi:hypothetical protein
LAFFWLSGSPRLAPSTTELCLSGGLENIYTAIPGVGGAAETVTDTLVTPLGVIDLDALFSGIGAIAPLDPGDAFTAGLDAASAAVTSVDPLAFPGL